MNGVITGGHSVDKQKLGGQNAGTHGEYRSISAVIVGGHRFIGPACGNVHTPGAVAAGYEIHGFTYTGDTAGEIGTHGTVTDVPLGPIVPIAPAGSEPASIKILAMANAIRSFTLIINTLLS